MTEPALAVFGGGCFWCLEAIFAGLRGVEQVTSGYAGGELQHPSYEAVCHGASGHAEVVAIRFDPQQISYTDLLTVFFASHDPTTRNRQGNDIGPQYRSVIFCQNDDQRRLADQAISALAQETPRPIVTELAGAAHFWPAEDYHRDYFTLHPQQPYCQAVVGPKVAKVRQLFADQLK